MTATTHSRARMVSPATAASVQAHTHHRRRRKRQAGFGHAPAEGNHHGKQGQRTGHQTGNHTDHQPLPVRVRPAPPRPPEEPRADRRQQAPAQVFQQRHPADTAERARDQGDAAKARITAEPTCVSAKHTRDA